jgi:glucose/arabinose dehydrogenase
MRRALVVCTCLALGACDDSPQDRFPPAIQEISGSERIGWDQPAGSVDALNSLRYFIYVDNVASDLEGASCAASAGSAGFACSAPLPPLSAGAHTLAVSAYVNDAARVEGPRSVPLSVVVGRGSANATAPSTLSVATNDGVRLNAVVTADGLQTPTDLAFAADGRFFVSELDGRILTGRNGVLQPAPAATIPDGAAGNGHGLLSLALDPHFADNGFLYAVYTSRDGFRLARYRSIGAILTDRVVLLDGVAAAAAAPAAALRFGPDGQLYLALDNAGDPQRGGDMGSFSGKVLRLNPDGTTPADQPASSPVFLPDVASPQGVGWDAAGTTMWMVDQAIDTPDLLRAVPSAPGQSGAALRYRLTPGTGAGGMVVYRGALIPEFAGDLFIAATQDRSLMRLHLDPEAPRRVVSTERLLRDAVGPITLVAVDPAGALYVGAPPFLIRMAPALARPRN